MLNDQILVLFNMLNKAQQAYIIIKILELCDVSLAVEEQNHLH